VGVERPITAIYAAQLAAGVWRAVLELADRQWGVVALEQLVALGIPKRTTRSWIEAGRLQRLHRGVYCVGHRALRAEGHWLAAVLACGARAVLSHRSAAALQDLRTTAAAAIDVTVPGRIGRTRSGIRVHSGDGLQPDEVTEVRGIPCTTIARTTLDLASVLPRRGVEQFCEAAPRRDGFDPFALTALIGRHRGRRGVATLRSVVAEWDPDLARTRSELEVRFLRLVIGAGLERPVVNGLIEAGGSRFEVDFHWPEQRLIVETDGRAFHDNPVARRRDADRDRVLASAGWRIQRFDWPDVTAHAARTRAALRDRLRASSGS
jgi:predicted transcriptional regulator of viral defense system